MKLQMIVMLSIISPVIAMQKKVNALREIEILLYEEMNAQEEQVNNKYHGICQVCKFRAFVFESLYYAQICAICFERKYPDCQIPHKLYPKLIKFKDCS